MIIKNLIEVDFSWWKDEMRSAYDRCKVVDEDGEVTGRIFLNRSQGVMTYPLELHGFEGVSDKLRCILFAVENAERRVTRDISEGKKVGNWFDTMCELLLDSETDYNVLRFFKMEERRMFGATRLFSSNKEMVQTFVEWLVVLHCNPFWWEMLNSTLKQHADLKKTIHPNGDISKDWNYLEVFEINLFPRSKGGALMKEWIASFKESAGDSPAHFGFDCVADLNPLEMIFPVFVLYGRDEVLKMTESNEVKS
jgi:hypothetical protein